MDTTSIASSRTEDTPKGVNILQMAEFKQADRLRKIAETARARTMAQRYAYQNLKKAEEMAEEGITEFKDRIMTLEFFKANKQAIKVPPGVDPDDYVETLYKAQKESYKLMEDEGFKVTYEELDLPSTLDINMDAQTRRMVEETKRFTESTVTVSWE
jgi:sugar phosphate isomerase/epimerase